MPRDEGVAEVRRRLTALRAGVFAAVAEASLVCGWLPASREFEWDVVHFAFRVGGSYRFAYRVPGRDKRVAIGVYRPIDPPLTIVFSWDIEPPDEHAGVR